MFQNDPYPVFQNDPGPVEASTDVPNAYVTGAWLKTHLPLRAKGTAVAAIGGWARPYTRSQSSTNTSRQEARVPIHRLSAVRSTQGVQWSHSTEEPYGEVSVKGIYLLG